MRWPKLPSRRTARPDRESFEARARRALLWSPEVDEDLLWFWIGSHADYDRLIR